MVTVVPLTVQTAVVELENVRVDPDVSEPAGSVNVPPPVPKVSDVGAVHEMVWGMPSTVNVSAFDVMESAFATKVTDPTFAPVSVIVATPLAAVATVSPVDDPLPAFCVNDMGLALSDVSTLPKLSSIVAVAVQVVSDTTLGGQLLANTTWKGVPAPVGVNELLGSDARVPDVAVIVYEVPTTPPKAQLATFTTPAVAVNPVHDVRLPVEGEGASVIEAVDEVTTLPAESSIFTIGWTVIGEPESPATGCKVKTSWLGAPGPVGENVLLGKDVSESAAAVAVKV
jgi:hypothetical protein